jgi:hypothetical protein
MSALLGPKLGDLRALLPGGDDFVVEEVVLRALNRYTNSGRV